MRYVFIILLSIISLAASAQEDRDHDLQLMEDVKGLMRNSYMEVKWIDDTHFTYTADEKDGRIYYIVDTKSWKPQRMFDNKVFADSLNKISQGGGRAAESPSWISEIR